MQTELHSLGYELNETDNFNFSELLEQYINAEIYKRSRFDTQFSTAKEELALPDWLSATLDAESESESDKTPLFSAVHAEFLDHKINKNKLSQSMQRGYALCYSDWSDYFRDQKVGSITRKQIRKFLSACLELPKRNVKNYKMFRFTELLAMDILEGDLVTVKTVDQARKWLQSVFAYAVKEMEVLDTSPASALNMDLGKTNSYAPYTDSEIRTLLQKVSELDKPAWTKYLIPLAIYTGARRTELVQLTKDDIKFDDDSHRHYIRITNKGDGQEVKTTNAIRQIPIHQKLIDLGFLKFVDSANSNVFEGLKSQQVTQWFGEFRDRCQVESESDYGGRKVFHSFRHSFITKSIAMKNPKDHVQQVVGHEKGRVDVTDRYTHLELKDLLDVVDLVDFG